MTFVLENVKMEFDRKINEEGTVITKHSTKTEQHFNNPKNMWNFR